MRTQGNYLHHYYQQLRWNRGNASLLSKVTTLKLLFEEKHCARKKGSAKVYFFVVKLRIKFKVLSLNITHFFNCERIYSERIYNKYIILTVTWSEESDHVLIQPFGSSYCYNNIILTISRFEKLHVQTNR